MSSLNSSSYEKAVAGQQSGVINLLKGGAAQLIVLHHLAFYGPMADHVQPYAPGLIGWLYSDARIAVQVFLVVSGFLAAKSLCPCGHAGIRHPLRALWQRYLRLVPLFLIATLLTIGASAWTSQWMTHDSISPLPGVSQVIAHALLLHSVLGYESISAGAWYVAIDLQLYASFIFLLWFSARLTAHRPLPWMMPFLVVIFICLSLLHFNRDSSWDVWALYFFGSYGVGILAWWVSDPTRRPTRSALLLAAMLIPTLLALIIDYRSRIAVALAVAGCLVLIGRARVPWLDRSAAVIWVGQASYAMFLIHFPVCLIVNAAFTRFAPAQLLWQAGGMLVAWAASLAAGFAFHRWAECPIDRWLGPSRRMPTAAAPTAS